MGSIIVIKCRYADHVPQLHVRFRPLSGCRGPVPKPSGLPPPLLVCVEPALLTPQSSASALKSAAGNH